MVTRSQPLGNDPLGLPALQACWNTAAPLGCSDEAPANRSGVDDGDARDDRSERVAGSRSKRDLNPGGVVLGCLAPLRRGLSLKAAQFLLDQADVAAVSHQVHLALFYDMQLDIGAMKA